MENHPIPQDVTGFQFKLIGNLTVKQFAYLASGIIFAWVLLQLPINILIKFPFSSFSAIFGVGLAYFPISGRPMDLMIGNYIKALFRPTQFVYEKIGGQIYFPNKAPFAIVRNVRQYKNDFNPFPRDKLKAYLESLDAKPKNKVDEKESNFLMSVSSLATGNAPQINPQPNLITYSDLPKPLEQKRVVAQQPIATIQPTNPTAPLIKPLLRGINKTIGIPSVPDSPNLITGITKDARGNALSNILVEVRDKDGNPVRAFKTNELGRFASATPLTNGTYIVEFKDSKAQNRFGKMTVNVDGQIILPIEAISIDAREELRRSLFASSTPPVPGGAKN